MTFLLLVLGALCLAGIGFAVHGARQLARASALLRGGALADAEVVDVAYLRPQTTANPRSGLFHPVVRFRTASGEVVEAPTTVGATPAPARPGDRVRVRYDLRRPRQVELASGAATSSTLGWLLVVLGVAVALLAGAGIALTAFLYQTFS